MLANTDGTQRGKKRFCPQTSVYNKFCKINSVKEIAKGSTVQNICKLRISGIHYRKRVNLILRNYIYKV